MTVSDRERRVAAARHRDLDWAAEVAALRDTDPLFYEISLIDEGYGDSTPYLLPADPEARSPRRADQRRAAYDRFEHVQRERLAVLAEARPEQAPSIAEDWASWWQDFRGI
ncbi:MAG: hypothetical protein JXX28_18600 [Deltaproteobacteria bacterium]|nr:hypothetical protein [Deltaproteobacteria bacterium]